MGGSRCTLVVGSVGMAVVVADVTAVGVRGARHHRRDGDRAEAETDRRQPEPRRGGPPRPTRPTAQRHE